MNIFRQLLIGNANRFSETPIPEQWKDFVKKYKVPVANIQQAISIDNNVDLLLQGVADIIITPNNNTSYFTLPLTHKAGMEYEMNVAPTGNNASVFGDTRVLSAALRSGGGAKYPYVSTGGYNNVLGPEIPLETYLNIRVKDRDWYFDGVHYSKEATAPIKDGTENITIARMLNWSYNLGICRFKNVFSIMDGDKYVAVLVPIRMDGVTCYYNLVDNGVIKPSGSFGYVIENK